VLFLEGGVDGDGETHVRAELRGESMGDLVTNPRLDDVLGEVVRHLDQGSPVEQPHEAGQAEEGALGGWKAFGVKGAEGVVPDLGEVQI
jgi:hypothetical protein